MRPRFIRVVCLLGAFFSLTGVPTPVFGQLAPLADISHVEFRFHDEMNQTGPERRAEFQELRARLTEVVTTRLTDSGIGVEQNNCVSDETPCLILAVINAIYSFRISLALVRPVQSTWGTEPLPAIVWTTGRIGASDVPREMLQQLPEWVTETVDVFVRDIQAARAAPRIEGRVP